MTFGDRLESLRKGLTQKEFSKSLGIPLNSYTNWVRGIREPSMNAIISICTQLSVSADWLLGLSERGGSAAVSNQPRGKSAADCSSCKYKRLADAFKAL